MAEYLDQYDPELDMTWNSPTGDQFHWVHTLHGTLLEVIYKHDLPQAFDADLKARFTNSEEGLKYVMMDTLGSKYRQLPEDYEYFLKEPRLFSGDQKCLPISPDSIVNVLKEKEVLFYTGAGISAASEVPTMETLQDMLFLRKDVPFDQWIVEVGGHQVAQLESKIIDFFKLCFNQPPTKAHKALRDIALRKQSPLFTENLDHLHERSGVSPNRIDTKTLRTKENEEKLKQLDAVICLGLSHDDRGFLAWYKSVNPNGIIIAIDLKQPNYLGSEDYFCEGDLQFALPWLNAQLKTK